MLRIASAAVLALVFTLAATPASAQGVPGIDPNKCLAAKNKCVSKNIAGLLKCRAKCQKSPTKCGPVQAACEQKVRDKFDGGGDPTRSCFAKRESKADPARPESVCTTTDDATDVAAAVEAASAGLLDRLEGNPPSCGDGVVNVVGEQCDLSNMNGSTCQSFGHPFGRLTCNQCRYSTALCDCAASGGVEVAGACWYWFISFTEPQRCRSVCEAYGLSYDPATRTVAGSDGTNANCVAVLNALGINGSPVVTDEPTCLDGFGCYDDLFNGPTRCLSPPTHAEASPAEGLLACACK